MKTRMVALAALLFGFSALAEENEAKPLLYNYPPALQLHDALYVLGHYSATMRETYKRLSLKGGENLNDLTKIFGPHFSVTNASLQKLVSRNEELLDEAWIERAMVGEPNHEALKRVFRLLRSNPDEIPFGQTLILTNFIGATDELIPHRIESDSGGLLFWIEILRRAETYLNQTLSSWKEQETNEEDELVNKCYDRFSLQEKVEFLEIDRSGEPELKGGMLMDIDPEVFKLVLELFRKAAEKQGILNESLSKRLDSVEEAASGLSWIGDNGGVPISNIEAFLKPCGDLLKIASELDPHVRILPLMTHSSNLLMDLDLNQEDVPQEKKLKVVHDTFAELDEALSLFLHTKNPNKEGLFVSEPFSDEQIRAMVTVQGIARAHAETFLKDPDTQVQKNALYRAVIQEAVGY